MSIVIVCCLHGNEQYGLEVARLFFPSIPFFIGNKRALIENKSFIEFNLNRIFPGKKNGNYEERVASNLLKKLKNFKYVVDLHSSSNHCPLFGIITKPNKEKIELAQRMGLDKLVIMMPSFANNSSLIDYVNCGISLEIGPHERIENIQEVSEIIRNLVENKNRSDFLEIFEVFGKIKKEYENVLIKNFENIKKGQILSTGEGNKKQIADFDFTAILVNEESYGDVLCLAGKQINFKTKNC